MLTAVPDIRASRLPRRAPRARPADYPGPGTVRVLKFGGSSVATPDRIRAIGAIVLDATARAPVVVVVSAFAGVTDQLIACARRAGAGEPFDALYDAIAARHRACVDALGGMDAAAIAPLVDDDLRELGDTLLDLAARRACPPELLDAAASIGERLSAVIVAGYLNQFRATCYVDARRLVITDDRFTRATVRFDRTNRAVRGELSRLWRRSPRAVPVITGFIGATADGRTTTIGRNGSDYTAAIVGAALAAAAIEIWTDVDGVMSADPRLVRSAAVLPQLTYDDARDLANVGARVIHPAAIEPAIARSIPILVRNTFNPDAPGTRIAASAGAAAPSVNALGDIALLTLSADGPLPSAAARLFGALAARGIETIFGSHSAFDGTIAVVIHGADAEAAMETVRMAFAEDLDAGTARLKRHGDKAIVAAVGGAAADRSESAGRMLGSLARHGVRVTAISPFAGGRHVACLIDDADRSRALAIAHHAAVAAPTPIALAIVGVGRVGSALLRELCDREASLRSRGVEAHIVAIADSRRFVVSRDGLDPAVWREALETSSRPMDARVLAREVAALGNAHGVLVDCTAAQAVVDAYPDIIEAGMHIVAPNKLGNVQPWPQYAALRAQLADRRRYFYDSTNVGAGLPILSTVRHLIAGGGTVSRIEGIVSGTLNHLFTAFDGDAPFSALVRDAHRLGLTEPDPRHDLGGHDVARKLLILAREAGLTIDLEDVDVESLVPDCLRGGSFSESFFDAYAAFDASARERLERARQRGRALRYVATLDRGRASAGVRELPADHPLAAARGCDNIVAITSDRSERTPLVVCGAGAGAEVTARGIVADLCALAARLRD